ncbi:hypothetical protein Avbf_13765 [Armadillidium vulgare]|nr:hypothetical protein Avbf_13765 [Armadillidium vulgare]
MKESHKFYGYHLVVGITKLPVKTLPFSVDECDISNFTSINISKSEEFNHIANNSSENSTADEL